MVLYGTVLYVYVLGSEQVEARKRGERRASKRRTVLWLRCNACHAMLCYARPDWRWRNVDGVFERTAGR
jgi:hypothetical protein